MFKLLVVEDDPSAAFLAGEFLNQDKIDYKMVDSIENAVHAINHDHYDIILLDLILPDGNGIDFITDYKDQCSDSVIIVLTGQSSTDSAMKAIEAGAKDYIVKPLSQDRLKISLLNATEHLNLVRQTRIEEDKISKPYIFKEKIVGGSPEMKDLYTFIENSAPSNKNIMLCGESGTGKSMVARMIHDLSPRKDKPFIKLNSADFEISAKTAAALKEVKDGTLYIKNALALPEKAQNQLQIALDDDADFCVIGTCSPADFKNFMNGYFDDGLYHKVSALNYELPPLRSRMSDIPALATYFLAQANKSHNKSFKKFDNGAFNVLQEYYWPGNVRELKNWVESICVLQPNAEVITQDMLPPLLSYRDEEAALQAQNNPAITNLPFASDEIIPIRDLEAMAIEHALNVCDGNVQKAATLLKVSTATLYRKKPQ